MKSLPKIHFWTDRIDDHVISVHAVRGWGDRPSNGVFLLVACPDYAQPTWTFRQDIEAELVRRLKERERTLMSWYGPRDWRNHLCDRIRHGQPIAA